MPCCPTPIAAIIWLLLLGLPLPALALDLPSTPLHGLNLSPAVSIHHSPQHDFEVSRWLSDPSSATFIPHQGGEMINLGYSNDSWWLLFALTNLDDSTRQLLLAVDFPLHDSLALHQIDEQDSVTRQVSGDLLPFSERAVNYRMFVFSIDLPPGANHRFLLQVRGYNSLQLPLHLWDAAPFMEQVFKEQYLLGLYYGIMLVMLFYNLILYYRIHAPIYLLYSGYIASLLLVQMSMDGLAFQYFWPTLPYLGNLLIIAFIFLSTATSIAFSRSFLSTARYLPRLDRVLVGALALALIFLLIGLTGMPLMSMVSGLYAAACALLLLLTGFMALRAKVPAARYYLIAWGFFLIGTLLVALKAMGLLPAHPLTTYGMHFGSALEVVLFSLGLADRINRMRHDKEQAQLALLSSKQEALELQQRLTHAYQRFVPHEFLELLDKRDILEVGLGDQVQRDMTILFSDIRSFTTLSERMTPEENFRFINDYLAAVGPLVREHGGYIDKFIGDAVMALFSRSADESVAAAIAMFERLREESAHGRFGQQLEIGVGINTGSMMLGTLGEHNRMEGTVISDAVNLAARLEGLTKFYGTPLLISEFTLAALTQPGQRQTRFIDRVRVKGKAHAVEVYEVCDAEPAARCAYKMAIADGYLAAWQRYRDGDFAAAESAFRALRQPDQPDRSLEVFIERCQQAQRLGAQFEPEGELLFK